MSASSSSHAVRMDRNYRFQRHIYDVTRKHYLFGRGLLIERLKPPAGGTVLEIGSGTASNLIAAAERYPAVNFYGVDISAMMLATARNGIERRRLSHRIRLQLADAAKLDARANFGEAAFDRVFLSYSLSMIPDWRGALAAALAHVKPGGSLHLVDFGRMEDMPRAARNALRLWLHFNSVTPRDEVQTALNALAQDDGAQLELRSLRRGYAIYAEIVRRA
jgi:S-adenosylmethionine-diacylgycerolhomoserine-N-methlytransferase